MITTIHHDMPLNVSKQIIKSIIGSLNATAIAYARGHLRFNAIENVAARKDEVPTIDDYNDAQNAIDEANTRNTEVAPGMGFNVEMQSGELAENLMRLRSFFAAWLEQHKAMQNDVPLSIAETVKFQMSRQPSNDDAMIEALALAVDIDPELLKHTKLKMEANDAADLKANAGKIITYLEAFEQYGKDEAGQVVCVTNDDDARIESMFATLPAHVQYKLMSAAIRAHDKAQEKALMALLRGKLDAAGDIKMVKAHRADLLTWLVTFSKAKRVQLDAYLERGGVLMEIEDRTIVTTNTVQTKHVGMGDVSDAARNTAQAPQAPIAPIGSCEVKHDAVTREPKVIGAPRRSKKAVTA